MEQLLALITLVQRTYGRWLFRRLLSGMIVVAGLVLTTAIMVSTALIVGLYAAYISLINAGFEQQMAVLMVCGITVVAAGLLVIATLGYLRHLRQMPQNIIKKSPITSLPSDALDAFISGLLTEKVK
jgi:uncharacterized membrane protein